VIPPSSYYDRDTLNSLLDDAIAITSALGLAANASKETMFVVSLEDAMTSFERLQLDSNATDSN
jgi:hypothetical protein